MAKRLNKRVAIIGILFLAVVGLVGVIVVAKKLIKPSAEEYLAEARAEVEKGDFELAQRNYSYAVGRAKDLDLKVDILFEFAEFYKQQDNWDGVVKCWNTIVTNKPGNLEARRNMLDYFYTRADSGERALWKLVEENADEFIKETEKADESLDPEIYLMRGKANFYLAQMGQVSNRVEALDKAIENLEKYNELAEDAVDGYQFLANAIRLKGELEESAGVLAAKEKAKEQAMQTLEQCVELYPNKPQAHINLLSMQIQLAENDEEKIQQLGDEYQQLVDKFPDSAEALAALSRYRRWSREYEKATTAAMKAIELEPDELSHVSSAADSWYVYYSVTGDKEGLDKAIELAEKALTMPQAQDQQGITKGANRMRRLGLLSFLSKVYLEQAIYTDDEQAKEDWLAKGKQKVHELKQIMPASETIYIDKWDGLVALAEGDQNKAMQKLYGAYQRLAADDRTDGDISYTLARIFSATPEIGATFEFYSSALRQNDIRMTKPDALLSTAQLVMRLNPNNPATAMSYIEAYEKWFGQSDRSKQLKTNIHISAKEYEQAQDIISQMDSDDPNRISLEISLTQAKIQDHSQTIAQRRLEAEQADEEFDPSAYKPIEDEIDQLRRKQTGLVAKLVENVPSEVGRSTIAALLNFYISDEKYEKAQTLLTNLQSEGVSNSTTRLYEKILAQPEPNDIEPERRLELTEQALMETQDPKEKAMSLAQFYQVRGELDKAKEHYQKALDIDPNDREAFGMLFDVAKAQDNIELMEELAKKASEKNMDLADGHYYSAQVAIAKEEFNSALEKLNDCIETRPVFSMAYVLRSQVHNALGSTEQAVQDAYQAAQYNPTNGLIAKHLALTLYERNRQLGDTVSTDQEVEVRNALQRALSMNQNDSDLLLFYADYLSNENPVGALSMLQRIHSRRPTIQTALRIARLSMGIANNPMLTQSPEDRDFMYQAAEEALQDALRIDPENRTAIELHAELMRITGRQKEAEEMIKDQASLLWRFYYRNGQFDKAKQVLQQIYTDANSPDQKETAIRGMMMIGQQTRDAELIKQYGQELVNIDPSDPDRNIAYIQMLLEVGIVDEAKLKLASFREKNPNEPRAMLLEAWVDMSEGNLDEAIELVNTHLSEDPENARAWLLKGEINYLMGNYNDAISAYRQSKSLEPLSNTYISLARVLRLTGRYSEAITELKIALDEGTPPRQTRLMLEDIYKKQNSEFELKKFYENLIEENPDDPFWLYRYAGYAQQKEDLGKAEQLYLMSWEKSQPQGNSTALDGYLETLIQDGKYEKALSFASGLVDGDYSIIAYARMAQAKAKLGDINTAQEYISKAMNKAGDIFGVISTVIDIGANALGNEKMISIASQYLDNAEQPILGHYAMTDIYNRSQQYNKALEHVEKAIEMAKNERVEMFLQQRKTMVLQAAWDKTADKKYLREAVNVYESMLEKMPNNTGALNNLAYLLAQANEQIDKAKEYAAKAFKMMPNHAGIMDTYAYVLLKNQQYDQAHSLLLRAVQRFEQEQPAAPAEVYQHLGQASENIGEIDQALASYRKALEIGRDELSQPIVAEIEQAIQTLENQQ